MMNYKSKQTSYDIAYEVAQKAKKILGLSEYDRETLEQDINNLRAHEWLDLFDMIPDSNEIKKLYFTHCVELEDETEQELEEAMKNKENKLNRKEVKESMGDKVNGKEASKASEIKYPTDIKKVLDSSKGEDLLIYTPAGLGTYHKILQWIKQNGKTVKVYKSDDEVIDGDILDILLLDSVELIGYVLTVYNHYKKAGKQVIYLPYNTPVDLNLRNKFRTIFLYGASPENGFEKIEEQFNEKLKEDMEDKTYQITVKYHNKPNAKIEARSAKDRKDLEYQLNMDDEVEWYDFDEKQFNESFPNYNMHEVRKWIKDHKNDGNSYVWNQHGYIDAIIDGKAYKIYPGRDSTGQLMLVDRSAQGLSKFNKWAINSDTYVTYDGGKTTLGQLIDLDEKKFNESLDQAREKALKMKENSNAFAILYGYRTKDAKEVELGPEEFATEEEYKDRIQQITNSFTKLSDKDPRGNRYGKEHNITFYTVYPNKKYVSESVNPKFNQPKYSFEIYNGREWYKGPSADTLDLLLGPNLFMALLDRHAGKDMRIIDVVDSDIIIDSKEFDKLQKQIDSMIKRKGSIDIDKIEKLLKSIVKKTNINESVSTDKWNIGSDKSKLNNEEIALLDELAQKLESSSVNGYKYAVQHTYEDFGSGMQWYTVVCYDKKGNSWQILDTKEWLQLMNTGDVEAVYNDVINGKYFQDKESYSTFRALDNLND